MVKRFLGHYTSENLCRFNYFKNFIPLQEPEWTVFLYFVAS